MIKHIGHWHHLRSLILSTGSVFRVPTVSAEGGQCLQAVSHILSTWWRDKTELIINSTWGIGIRAALNIILIQYFTIFLTRLYSLHLKIHWISDTDKHVRGIFKTSLLCLGCSASITWVACSAYKSPDLLMFSYGLTYFFGDTCEDKNKCCFQTLYALDGQCTQFVETDRRQHQHIIHLEHSRAYC